MTHEGGPVCARHGGEVRMRLQTMHSDAGRPGEVVGQYVCPECGHERRLPLEPAA